MPIRRNGSAKPVPPTTVPPQHPQRPRPPLLPTPLEALLLAIYPSTLLVGSIFSLLEPHARVAPYSALLQSHPSASAPSYFAQKKNLFNVFFVKIGWFWTSFAFLVFLFLHPSTGPSRSLVLTRRRLQGLLRYGLLTVWWMLVTQWFFGPGLVDRGFLLTGGKCEQIKTEEGRARMGETEEFFTAAACKAVGGQWKGGHDISGHVFLLVLGSAFLGFEILPVVGRWAGLREMRMVKRGDGGVGSAEGEAVVETVRGLEGEGREGLSVPVGVVGLMWWMLLMTAAYFHTWFEKVGDGLILHYVWSSDF
ncbi:hypothetical protein MMC30_001274 [Trapelia coarctata]|nr:hypothetical protein [Trapelia coarctata]